MSWLRLGFCNPDLLSLFTAPLLFAYGRACISFHIYHSPVLLLLRWSQSLDRASVTQASCVAETTLISCPPASASQGHGDGTTDSGAWCEGSVSFADEQ